MASERELLEKLIVQRLGPGTARFEVQVGGHGKRIDMVFEKDGETWLVEAKQTLDHGALGQVLDYKDLYQQHSPVGNPKLAIVCSKTDLEIEATCRAQGVEVFVLAAGEDLQPEPTEVMCGVCGEMMALEGLNWTCKTCEHIFGASSKPEQCTECPRKFGEYLRVLNQLEWALRSVLNPTRAQLCPLAFCPHCRMSFRPPGEWTSPATYAGWVSKEVSEGRVMPRALVESGLPQEFVDFALGKMKPYF